MLETEKLKDRPKKLSECKVGREQNIFLSFPNTKEENKKMTSYSDHNNHRKLVLISYMIVSLFGR